MFRLTKTGFSSVLICLIKVVVKFAGEEDQINCENEAQKDIFSQWLVVSYTNIFSLSWKIQGMIVVQ